MINICVPVLRRYDLLRDMLISLRGSTMPPHKVCIIDNGLSQTSVLGAIDGAVDRAVTVIDVFTPREPMGVAASWNWFIQNIGEERLIINDDIVFAPTSLERIIDHDLDLAWAAGCGFACYLIRNRCIDKLGLFDETISPGYGYYEDEDYLQRLDGRGTREPSARAGNIECGIVHLKSATLQAATHLELLEHHRKFKIAQANYARKWHLEAAFQ